MAESLAEKLKRLAREKAEAKAKAESSAVAEVTEVANVQPVEEKVDAPESRNERSSSNDGSTGQGNSETVHDPVSLETELVSTTDPVGSQSLPVAAASNHPLAMQFLELEQALDSTDASFKVKLRDIHRHLGKDPDLVTQMTEAEIALVVKGLVIFANGEIVEPAKAKTVKAATAAAKKKVISADDL